MKYIKRFENIEDVPKVGNFVLISMNRSNSVIKFGGIEMPRYNKIKDFVTHNIGKIVNIRLKIVDEFYNKSAGDLRVEYDNIPKDIQSWFSKDNKRAFSVDQIVEFGKTKEELEEKLMTKKYNI